MSLDSLSSHDGQLSEAKSRGGSEIDVCDGGYEVGISRYTVAARDESADLVWVVAMQEVDDPSDTGQNVLVKLCGG